MDGIGCSFAVGAIRPRAWQLPVFVTMLGARFHSDGLIERLRRSYGPAQ
jgi:hypothetical protein